MNLLKHKIKISCPGWDSNEPTHYFSQPYSFLEGLEWIYHVLINPPRSHCPIEEFVPDNSLINIVAPQVKLGFIGDIMVLDGMELSIGEDIKTFFSDADFMVGNFEGTIVKDSHKPVFMAQAHAEGILDILAGLFPPERTLLSCANNHAGDYGWDGFCASYQHIQDRGFIIFGRRDEPSVLIDGKVNIAACTSWSNQKCKFVALTDDANKGFLDNAEFNILYPHWGYEMQMRPKDRQIRQGRELLATWDMVIGHHAHCPQPVSVYESHQHKSLVAYSLGNFCSSENTGGPPIGMILKVEIGPDNDGIWAVGRINWAFIYASHNKSRCVEIGMRRPDSTEL